MKSLMKSIDIFGWEKYQRVHSAERLLGKEPLSGASDSESDLDSEGFLRPVPQSHSKRLAWLSAALLFFMMSSLALLVAFIQKRPTDEQCGIQTTVWSPANNAIEYEEIDFENAFAHETKYRGPPTPELEREWEKLWYYGGVRIPEDKLPLLNRTMDLGNGRTLKAFDDGQGGYHALIEVFHQLHCLNLIRQYTWRDWYGRHEDIVRSPPDMRDSDVGARMHVDHCIEALRLSLMCHGDTTPYMILLDPTAPRGMRADFSPHHKCRKFDKLVDWAEENEAKRPPPSNWEPVKKKGGSS